MDIYSFFGKRVREERQKAHLTLEELSEMADISNSFLAYIELGKRKASLITVQKLSDALKIPICSLLSTKADHHPKPNSSPKLTSLLAEKSPRDRKLIFDVLKSLSKGLSK